MPPYPVPVRPALIRWDPSRPLTLENVVVMEFKEAEKHVKECYDTPEKGDTDSKDAVETVVDGCVDDTLKGKRAPEEVWGSEVAGVVRRRQEEIRRVREGLL